VRPDRSPDARVQSEIAEELVRSAEPAEARGVHIAMVTSIPGMIISRRIIGSRQLREDLRVDRVGLDP
jgi:hypothetical protein